ncbi:site-specific integrase [Haloarcula sp. CBA1130]|uniref:tyrosine-type recombinase/integrase n=1 Tax=unclassified Haloarcula TaxID=2624677 RepID=UPI001248F797|nr:MULTISPECIES: site-specific integrase [unclassified Haloarcula]KAA9399977.1 site-specific integrase [Haloarcula sp. CBA1129]KAA9404015.1 site-specific integrase [Haloarcula sp. CBA1130]
MKANTNPTDLQAITPVEALRLYLESKVDEWATATKELQQFHLNEFVEWLAEEDIDDMRNISARTVHRFRLNIKGDIAQSTLSQRVSSVRRFLQFCTTIDAVSPSVPERVEIPNRDTEARTETLEADHAEAALDYLERFAYASREHALLALCWHTGIRTGTLVALDVDDVEPAQNRLRIRHRPESDTPLKNGTTAERYVALSEDVAEVLEDYINHKRKDIEDDYGRMPLFATENGRAPVKTLRRWFQATTRPCIYGTECPHGRDKNECAAAQSMSNASDCPSSVSGHPIRRGAITHFLRKDVPEKVVSDRMNVSTDVLEQHYDRRTEDEKAEQRREYLDGL